MVDFLRHKDEPGVIAIDDVLDQRASTYGPFKDLSRVAVRLRRVIREELEIRQKVLDPDMEEALSMLCSKLARIINGDPTHTDDWLDGAGYLQLVADRLQGKVR